MVGIWDVPLGADEDSVVENAKDKDGDKAGGSKRVDDLEDDAKLDIGCLVVQEQICHKICSDEVQELW